MTALKERSAKSHDYEKSQYTREGAVQEAATKYDMGMAG